MIDQMRSKLLFISHCVIAVGIVAGAGATLAHAKGKPTPPPPPPPPPPVNYDIKWLVPAGPNDRYHILDVNRQGTTAVGSQSIGGVTHAVTIDVATGTVSDLNALLRPDIPDGWQLTYARGITDLGRIAGEARDNSGNRVLFVYDPADTPRFQPVGVGVGSRINYRDMNDAGDLLYAKNTSSDSYLYFDQQTVVLDPALKEPSEFGFVGPQALNNDRVIAGNRDAGFRSAYVYNYNTDATTNIASLFQANEINNTGTVVGRGSLSNKGNPTLVAMKYASGVKTPLTSLSSEAFEINDAGQVVGRINSTNRSIPTAFLYDPNDPTQGFWSLNDLIQDTAEDESFWNCSSGLDASLFVKSMSEPLSSGYPVIAGDRTVLGSMFPDGVDRHLGFILTPISPAMSSALVAASVPEPNSCLLVAIALLSLNAARRRRQVN
jgi:hypothetical protein